MLALADKLPWFGLTVIQICPGLADQLRVPLPMFPTIRLSTLFTDPNDRVFTLTAKTGWLLLVESSPQETMSNETAGSSRMNARAFRISSS